MSHNIPTRSLWTYDFTIITLGSVVSMVGSTLSGFAISLMVLDYTGSTWLYALFNVCYQLPMLVAPLLAGPYLDRMSRKKVIYRLDYLSSTIYLALFFLLRSGWFHYPAMMGFCLLIGAINGVYVVAYDSFYHLITEGNYSKAYSISSMLWPIAAMTQPIAAWVYDQLGRWCRCLPLTRCASSPPPASSAPSDTRRRTWTRPCLRTGWGHWDDSPGISGRAGPTLPAKRACWSSRCISWYPTSPAWVQHPPTAIFQEQSALFAAWPVAVVTLYTIVSNCWWWGGLLAG